MACDLYVNAPRLEIINGKQVVTATGGRRCTGGPGENEVSLTLRIRHHRGWRSDRTLAEQHFSDIAINLQASYDCVTGDEITVFAEVLLPGFWGAKKKSEYVKVRCNK